MLEQVWRLKERILRSIIRKILADDSCVDDVLQDAFSRLLRSNRQFSNSEEAYHYIRKTVVNTCIDHYRSVRRTSLCLKNLANSEACSLSQRSPSPLAVLMEQEKQGLHNLVLHEVQMAQKELTPEQKEAIDIIFNRSHGKIKDFCRERGIPYSTVRSRLTAAITKIRRRLKAKGVYQTYKATLRR